MARNGLVPKRIWVKKPISGKASTEEVCALAEKLKIHPAIIAGRIRFEKAFATFVPLFTQPAQ
jgi:HTH-type transcriptional regulator/antitoxin HigA